jgi:uncharacterized protein with PhoU and TrkA domain
MIFRVKIRRAAEFEILVEAPSLHQLQIMLTELSLIHDDEDLMTEIVSIHEAPNLFLAPSSPYWQ